jgi:hypothetical protein
MTDRDEDAAVRIGELYRCGKDALNGEAKRPHVTPIRNITGKMSGSRNTTPSSYAGPSIDATSCHACRQPLVFDLGRHYVGMEARFGMYRLLQTSIEVAGGFAASPLRRARLRETNTSVAAGNEVSRLRRASLYVAVLRVADDVLF